MSRKITLFLAVCTAIVFGALLVLNMSDRREVQTITVYKTPWCGCCTNWVEYIELGGFNVKIIEREDLTDVRQKHHVPDHLVSCHTAVVDGYAIEGHVPASEIHRLLKDRPQAFGIAVPGMPIGSPGMKQGGRNDPYDVILFGSGADKVFASYVGSTPVEKKGNE